jgi:glycyl-tRNA synthetase
MPDATVMEKLVSLCKRRGFIYPASEIYGGLNGFWDYGPLGVLLKNNIRDDWWRNMVICPPLGPDGHPIEMVGIDTAIIQHPTTWVASGHAAGFADPMVDDTETKQRFRADQLWGLYIEKDVTIDRRAISQQIAEGKLPAIHRTVIASSAGEAFGEMTDKKLFKPYTSASHDSPEMVNLGGGAAVGFIFPIPLKYQEANHSVIPSPFSQTKGTLTEPRQFNLMFESYVGAVRDDSAKVFLRPETAQGQFLNFKNVLDTTRVKVPFGVAQVGKSFRNEVTPRNFIFRSREFEQMEMEWFCHPDEAAKWYEFWKAQRMKWWVSLGVEPSSLRFRDHEKDELSHYSKMTVDIEYKYPFTAPDFGELEGIAHRGCFDLSQHAKHSGQKLDYFDQELQLKLKAEGKSDDQVKAASRYVPNVIEPASGLTRAVLVLLCEAYKEDAARASGVYLKFEPRLAPIKLGIFPLVNKEGMPETAEKIYLDLRKTFTCEYDAKQSIGKRYARMDEIGTPYCVTVDGQTAQDQTVTVRHRDDMKQDRVAMDMLLRYFTDRLGGP